MSDLVTVIGDQLSAGDSAQLLLDLIDQLDALEDWAEQLRSRRKLLLEAAKAAGLVPRQVQAAAKYRRKAAADPAFASLQALSEATLSAYRQSLGLPGLATGGAANALLAQESGAAIGQQRLASQSGALARRLAQRRAHARMMMDAVQTLPALRIEGVSE
jgi:hypothetical protein